MPIPADPDMLPLPVTHSYGEATNAGITFACGLFWKRGEEKIRATTQDADVTCDGCIEALKARGLR